jgi:type I restriction enzyme, R subunit
MPADTSEKRLESLIMRHMTGSGGLASGAAEGVAEAAPVKGSSGWFTGTSTAYDRKYSVDTEQLFAFLIATQPEEWAKLGVADTRTSKVWSGRSSWPACKGKSRGAG